MDPYFDLIKIGSVQAIMTGQIINQNLDKDLFPTTLNKQTITYLLRKELGYEGVIFSNDIRMAGLLKTTTPNSYKRHQV